MYAQFFAEKHHHLHQSLILKCHRDQTERLVQFSVFCVSIFIKMLTLSATDHRRQILIKTIPELKDLKYLYWL